jgi:quercetin dioxygenase-like cupin family protein
MPVLDAHQYTPHAMHGSRFCSYASPSSGAEQLCAWRTEVAPRTTGAPHTVSHEEVFLVLKGTPTVALNGTSRSLSQGDVVVVPAGATLSLDNPCDTAAHLWVTTSVGLTATTADGSTITPPWTQ